MIGRPYTIVTPTPVRIAMKDEDEVDGEVIGPVRLIYPDGSEAALGWLRSSDALVIARTLRLSLEWE